MNRPIIRENYQEKQNRDKRAKELKLAGYDVKRTSYGQSQIHPEYVKDYPHAYQTGFGNIDYKTMFDHLYVVEAFEKVAS